MMRHSVHFFTPFTFSVVCFSSKLLQSFSKIKYEAVTASLKYFFQFAAEKRQLQHMYRNGVQTVWGQKRECIFRQWGCGVVASDWTEINDISREGKKIPRIGINFRGSYWNSLNWKKNKTARKSRHVLKFFLMTDVCVFKTLDRNVWKKYKCVYVYAYIVISCRFCL